MWYFNPLMDFKPIDSRAFIKNIDIQTLVDIASESAGMKPNRLFTWWRQKGMRYKRRMRLHRVRRR